MNNDFYNEICQQGENILTPQTNILSQLIDSGDNYKHCHKYIEMFYILHGSINHMLNKNVETLIPGDMYILRTCDVHSFIREPHNPCIHRDIMITPAIWEKTLEFLDLTKIQQQFKSSSIKIHLTTNQVHYLEDTLNRLPKYQDLSARKAYALMITTEILKIVSDNNYSNMESLPFWILKLTQKLELPESFQLNLSDIIAPYSYNASYIARSFKKHLGITMREYFLSCKLNYATLLLKSTPLSIVQIAEQSGFLNLSYFNRVFKERFNMTPKEYRNSV